MGGPEMAPHTPHTLGAPRPSRGTPRYSDRLLVLDEHRFPFGPQSPHYFSEQIAQAAASDRK
jgi:hypothetical protein